MARTCTVCVHPEREAINQALISGEAALSVAARYFTVGGKPLGRMAVQRHKENHIPETMAKAKEAQEVAHGADLLQNVRKLQNKAIQLLLKAEADGDYRTALAGIREARGCLELLAKLVGELSDAPTVNITISPQWVELRTVIVQALSEYPAARLAVAQALAEVEP
jgi:hypothetical protein